MLLMEDVAGSMLELAKEKGARPATHYDSIDEIKFSELARAREIPLSFEDLAMHSLLLPCRCARFLNQRLH
jgi:hypothetical protein